MSVLIREGSDVWVAKAHSGKKFDNGQWVKSEECSQLKSHCMKHDMVFASPGKPENRGPKVLIEPGRCRAESIERDIILRNRFVIFPDGEQVSWFELMDRELAVMATGNDKWPIMVVGRSVMCF